MNPKTSFNMKTFDYNGMEVCLRYETYRNNGTLAVEMDTVEDGDSWAVITVNLNCPLQNNTMAFVDENNLPGIGAWLKKNSIAKPLGYVQRSGFCTYELYSFLANA